MPQILKTIEEYVVEDRKRDSYYIVFNTAYNDVHTGNVTHDDKFDFYLNKDFTDNNVRDEFLQFMQTNFPNTKLTEVFDFVSPGYMIYPYLGTIAVDCEEGDDVYNAICAKYEDSDGNYILNNAVFWGISYDIALKSYNEKKEMWDDELE